MLVRVAADNAERLLQALSKLDARYRERQAFLNPTRQDILAGGHMLLMTRAGPLDVLGFIGDGKRFEDLVSASSEIGMTVGRLRVLDLAELIRQKKILGRPKDRAVAELLEEVLRRRCHHRREQRDREWSAHDLTSLDRCQRHFPDFAVGVDFTGGVGPVHRSPGTGNSRIGSLGLKHVHIIDILNIMSIMRYVSATDAKQRLAAILDAAQREPVTIKRQNREVAVVLSPEDYRRLTGANIEAFQRFCDQVSRRAAKAGMTEKKLERLLSD